MKDTCKCDVCGAWHDANDQDGALSARLAQAEQERDEYRIEADCGLRDFDALELEAGLTAERAERAEARLREVEGALLGLADVFAWIEENYPAALVAMPTELFRRIGVAGEALRLAPIDNGAVRADTLAAPFSTPRQGGRT